MIFFLSSGASAKDLREAIDLLGRIYRHPLKGKGVCSYEEKHSNGIVK
jgi:hypothetical protein